MGISKNHCYESTCFITGEDVLAGLDRTPNVVYVEIELSKRGKKRSQIIEGYCAKS